MKDLLFYTSLATLLTHELDAMTQSEWRLLFVLRSLPESIASNVFVIAHVPVVALVLWLTAHKSATIGDWSRLAIALFTIIHAGLHKHLELHPAYTFTSPLSVGLIYGAGVLGFIYLLSAAGFSLFSGLQISTEN